VIAATIAAGRPLDAEQARKPRIDDLVPQRRVDAREQLVQRVGRVGPGALIMQIVGAPQHRAAQVRPFVRKHPHAHMVRPRIPKPAARSPEIFLETRFCPRYFGNQRASR
jgi:hypothetical protein